MIEGTVRDSTGRAVDAYLTVSPKGAGNLIGFCDTDTAGAYRMEFRTEADSVVVTVAGLGIGQHARTVANRPQRELQPGRGRNDNAARMAQLHRKQRFQLEPEFHRRQ